MVVKKQIKNTKGFTFIELIVVIGIFAALTSIVLFNFRDFSEGVSLTNLTQQIALQVSNMQRNALAGSQPTLPVVPAPGETRWTPAFGLCFTVRSVGCLFNNAYGPNGQISAFVIFADSSNDNRYTQTNSERLDDVVISGGDYISNLCVDLQSTGNCLGVSTAEVVYTRPNAAPKIMYGNNLEANDLTITVSSPEGTTREVVVWKSGQVDIKS